MGGALKQRFVPAAEAFKARQRRQLVHAVIHHHGWRNFFRKLRGHWRIEPNNRFEYVCCARTDQKLLEHLVAASLRSSG